MTKNRFKNAPQLICCCVICIAISIPNPEEHPHVHQESTPLLTSIPKPVEVSGAASQALTPWDFSVIQ